MKWILLCGTIALASYACTIGEAAHDLPDGFELELVADGFEAPTSVDVSPDGEIFVSQYGGPVLRLEEPDGGTLMQAVEYASGRYFITGITFSPTGVLYISSMGRVSVAEDTTGDGVADIIIDVIDDLPTGAHQNNGLAFGPDGGLYITNGSTCNECIESDEHSATILRAEPDGSNLEIYATGLRNPYSLAFDPQGRLWATDNGSDPPCNTRDELNLIEEAADYGWPYSPACDNFLSGTPPAADLGRNTAATGIEYYRAAQFPPEYQDGLFITLWGSNVNAPQPAGRTLVHAAIDEVPDGPQVTIKEFASGFDHPIDVAVDSDGSLLVLDFGAGTLYRIRYDGA